MSNRERISVSDLWLYQNCGMKYYFKWVEKVQTPKTLALHIGSIIHYVLQKNLESIRDYDEPIPSEVIAEIARDAFDFKIHREGFEEDGKDPKGEIAREMAATLSVAHAEKIAPQIKPMKIEKYFRIQVPDRPYDISGYIDVIEKDLTLRDTKSTNKIPNIFDLEYSDQMTAYAMVVLIDFGKLPKIIKQDYLIKDPDGTCRCLTMVTHRTQGHINRFLARMDALYEAVEKGVYVPANASPQTCGCCQYKDVCPYFDPYSIKSYPSNEEAREAIKKTKGKKKSTTVKKKVAKKKASVKKK